MTPAFRVLLLAALLPAGAAAAPEPGAEVCAAGDGQHVCPIGGAGLEGDDELSALQLRRGPSEAAAVQVDTSRNALEDGMCNTTFVSCSCLLFPCHNNLGPVECKTDHILKKTCVCQPGFCIKDGKCVSTAKKVKAKVLSVNDEQPAIPAAQHVKTALVCSGGGSRALSFSIGVWRALINKGVFKKIDMLSTVSGSSWASSSFMFAKDRTDEQLVGAPTTPSELTLAFLRRVSSEIGAAATTSTNLLLLQALLLGTPFNHVWEWVIGQAFLKPFGLDASGAYLAGSADDVARIKRDNPALADATFLTPRTDRPRVYVMLSTLATPKGYSASNTTAVGLQMSPDYMGSPYYPNSSTVEYERLGLGLFNPRPRELTRVIGGGFVESFAFNGKSPCKLDNQNGAPEPVAVGAPEEPFTLVDAAGASSWSDGFALAMGPIGKIVDPESKYWPVTSDFLPPPNVSLPYLLTDGGNIDNSGLLPALQRGADTVYWVANSYRYLNRSYPWDAVCKHHRIKFDPIEAGVIDQVLDKFGFGPALTTEGQALLHNQVFDMDGVRPLSCAIWEKVEQGVPASIAFKTKVLPNTWWGIEGGHDVTIMMYYLENVTDFTEQLPQETQAQIALGDEGDFNNFPIYSTTQNNGLEITSLTMPQVNLLAAQGEYSASVTLDSPGVTVLDLQDPHRRTHW